MLFIDMKYNTGFGGHGEFRYGETDIYLKGDRYTVGRDTDLVL